MTRAEVLRACAARLRRIADSLDGQATMCEDMPAYGSTAIGSRELRTCAHDLANVLTVLRGEED